MWHTAVSQNKILPTLHSAACMGELLSQGNTTTITIPSSPRAVTTGGSMDWGHPGPSNAVLKCRGH